jgi:hypothetical protein
MMRACVHSLFAGVWWIVDTALLLGGVYTPAKGDFEWEPFTEDNP